MSFRYIPSRSSAVAKARLKGCVGIDVGLGFIRTIYAIESDANRKELADDGLL